MGNWIKFENYITPEYRELIGVKRFSHLRVILLIFMEGDSHLMKLQGKVLSAFFGGKFDAKIK